MSARKDTPSTLGSGRTNTAMRTDRQLYCIYLIEQLVANLESYATVDPKAATAFAAKLLETHLEAEHCTLKAVDADWCKEQIKNAVLRGCPQ